MNGGGLQHNHLRPITQHFPVPHESCACNRVPLGQCLGQQNGAVPMKVQPGIGAWGSWPREIRFVSVGDVRETDAPTLSFERVKGRLTVGCHRLTHVGDGWAGARLQVEGDEASQVHEYPEVHVGSTGRLF